jgi:hypothetical protein
LETAKSASIYHSSKQLSPLPQGHARLSRVHQNSVRQNTFKTKRLIPSVTQAKTAFNESCDFIKDRLRQGRLLHPFRPVVSCLLANSWFIWRLNVVLLELTEIDLGSVPVGSRLKWSVTRGIWGQAVIGRRVDSETRQAKRVELWASRILQD